MTCGARSPSGQICSGSGTCGCYGGAAQLCGGCSYWSFPQNDNQGWVYSEAGPGGGCAARASYNTAWPGTSNYAFRASVSVDDYCRMATISFNICPGGTSVSGRTFHAKIYARTDPYSPPANSTASAWLGGSTMSISSSGSFAMNTPTTVDIPFTSENTESGVTLVISLGPSGWYGDVFIDDAYIN